MTAESKPTFTFVKSLQSTFTDLLKPRAYKVKGVEKGDPRYGVQFIVEPDNEDFVRLKADIVKLIQTNNPGKKLVLRRLTQEELDAGNVIEVKVPWRSGTVEADKAKEKGKDAEIFRGKLILKTSSTYQPALGAIQNGAVVDIVTEEAKVAASKLFYSGAYLLPVVMLNYYKASEGKPCGVSLYPQIVVFHKDGPRLGGGQRSAAEAFKGYLGQISQEDPTEGMTRDELDDEISF